MTDYSLNRYLMQGTSTARSTYTPASPTVASGQPLTPMWFETDTGYLWAWNQTSSTWVKVIGSGGSGGGASYTAPAMSSFTYSNQPSGATAANITGSVGIQMYSPGLSSAFNLNYISQSPPTAPYTKWARISANVQANKEFTNFGIALSDSSGKLVTWSFFAGGGSTTGNGGGNVPSGELTYETYSSYSNRNSFVGDIIDLSTVPPLIGVYDDNTNLNFLVSFDGVSSFTPYSVSRTAYLSSGPTKLGFYTNGYSQACTVNLVHWASNLPGPI